MDLVRVYPPVGSGTSSTVSFVVLFLASMGVVVVVVVVVLLVAFSRTRYYTSSTKHDYYCYQVLY